MDNRRSNLVAVAVFSLALASCSGGSNDSNDESPNTPGPDSVSSAFNEAGLPGERLRSLIEDAVEPDALSELSAVTMSAQIWLDSIDATIPPEYFTDILAESDAVAQTFDCDVGSVNRKKWGNGTVASDRLSFDSCVFDNHTFNGTVLIQNYFRNSFCTGGPVLSFDLTEFDLITASGNQITTTGFFSYSQALQNCGSGAGGPPGFSNAVSADMSALSFGADGVGTTYTNYQLLNKRQEISAAHVGNEHTIELQVSISAAELGEQAIDVEFVEPMKVTSAVSESNMGLLRVDNNEGQSVTYAAMVCAKDMAVIIKQTTNTSLEENTVAWTDETNVLATLSVPGVRDHDTGAETGIRESTYDANQSIEGC